MKNTEKDYRRIVFIYGIFITVCIQITSLSCYLRHTVFLFPKMIIDDRTMEIHTSTEYRYPDRFVKTLSSYTDFRRMYQHENSTAIPGLEYTNFGNSVTNQMVPQGICIAKDYMLITAYDKDREHHSVIYVLSDRTRGKRELLTTIILPDKNHVGGITFDGEYIWIAKSSSGYCSGISYETIQEAVDAGEKCYTLSNYEENVYCGVTASFLTYDKEYLWIGTFQTKGKGTLACYRIMKGASERYLQKEDTIEIPSYAQGVSFLETAGRTYMILTASRGRHRDSNIYFYEMQKKKNEICLEEKGKYKFPPMAEEVTSDGEYTYFLFESAATCYSTKKYKKCTYPVDRICAVSNQEVLTELLEYNHSKGE